MRKYSVFLVVLVMALLTGCGSDKGLSNKSTASVNTISKPNVKTVPAPKPMLLNYTDTNGVMSYTLSDVDGKSLTTEETRQLDALANEIKAKGNCQVTVIGHADNIGTSEVNQAVSVKRARLVGDYLKNRGVSNITTSGESYNHPVAGNETAAGRAKNRRVEIFVSTIGKYNPYKK